MIVGYTTGVFDLFHIGHLNIITKAKEVCDYLIVGVSTDELVVSYKGKKPIVPFHDRKDIISALSVVDKVVAQNSMDKLAAWEKLKYNKYIHGNDWQNSELYNKLEMELKNVGVEICYFHYTEGVSTSNLKKIIYETGINESS